MLRRSMMSGSSTSRLSVSSSMRRSIPCLSGLLLAAVCSSQTFVVDASNGSGASYTTISQAVAAVPDGAVVVVRAGNYAGFSIQGKGLKVLAEAGVGITSAITVGGTLPGQNVVLSGLTMNSINLCYQAPWAIELIGCAGGVLLQDVNTPAGLLGPCLGVPVHAQGCTNLVMQDCGLSGRTELIDSRASLSGCTLIGRVVQFGAPSTVALDVVRSQVDLTGCQVTGGSGVPLAQHGMTAIVGTDASLRLLGATQVVVGSSDPAAAGASPAAVALTGSSAMRAALTAGITGVVQGVVVQTVDMPGVSAAAGPIGGQVSVSVASTPGVGIILLVGIRGFPVGIPGIVDPFWLTPGLYQFYSIGFGPGPGGQLNVPAMAVLRGLEVVWHAAQTGAAGGPILNSNPGVSLIY
jgi:hypothetical protein